MPLYTVGPATARTLSSLRDRYLPTSTIHGEETGTGEKLAHMMLDHYNGIQKEKDNDSLLQTVELKPGLLFLVGEQRRDIIPKTLMDPNLPDDRRINIDEMVVYETGEMESFEREFAANVAAYSGDGMWVVVFSPSGCEAMLRVLKLGPFAEGSDSAEETRKKVYIATIGPTTRDHLRTRFGFEPDVCADKPSPEGVGESIKRFMME